MSQTFCHAFGGGERIQGQQHIELRTKVSKQPGVLGQVQAHARHDLTGTKPGDTWGRDGLVFIESHSQWDRTWN